MTNKKEIKEDAPVTTTDNAGQGLIKPELPIKKANIFKRYKEMKKKDNSKDNAELNYIK